LSGRSAGAVHQAAFGPRSDVMSFSILIVDDEPDIADLFRQRFRREVRQGQYVLHFAGSGEEALRRFAEIRPELIVILSDINMPGMDGLELLGKIRRVRPQLPVLMVTAYGDDDRKHRADELGAAAFLAKPVDFEQLKLHLLRLMPGDPCK
jgi:CheY-like chemotaxis protein